MLVGHLIEVWIGIPQALLALTLQFFGGSASPTQMGTRRAP
jgi:hypothetical protein